MYTRIDKSLIAPLGERVFKKLATQSPITTSFASVESFFLGLTPLRASPFDATKLLVGVSNGTILSASIIVLQKSLSPLLNNPNSSMNICIKRRWRSNNSTPSQLVESR
ncbi:hypothetical protein V6N13_106759 [Hibiscus sabdariffa]|uniref:Uncharacterized protein n=1 Tax=Hibiscus sabdariffa TaxID=183260 RepID=A0ABR2F1P1_9ROSI